jgi:NAD(P)-dependent dehydrogenase (short-subunit alcohol dehydrogenase family)
MVEAIIETGLRDKVVLVTGPGIGLATTLRFACERCRVAAWDVGVSALTDCERQVMDSGGQGLFHQIDVTAARDVEEGVRKILHRGAESMSSSITRVLFVTRS